MQLLSYVPLCNSMDGSLPESFVYGIFQTRILEQVAISYSRGSSWPRDPSCIPFSFCIGRQILHHWTTWKTHLLLYNIQKPSLNLISSEYSFQTIWNFSPACQCRRCKRCGFDPWVEKIPWRRKRQPTPVFLPGESHEERSVAGYCP